VAIATAGKYEEKEEAGALARRFFSEANFDWF